MLKNDENKKCINSDDYNNNSNEFSSTSPTSLQKKFRKDAKGNLILKKKIQIKKTKHHISFIDKLDTSKNLVSIIDIESYKKYNLQNEDEIVEEEENNVKEDNKQLEGETNIVTTHGCCIII